MKKLNKIQKAKIKECIFKVLHILGYISIGLVVLFSIVLGVNGCQPKSQDHISLNENRANRAIDYNNLNVNTLYNQDKYGRIVVNANDVYVYIPNLVTVSSTDTISSWKSDYSGTANCGIYVFTYNDNGGLTSSQYVVVSNLYYLNNYLYCTEINQGSSYGLCNDTNRAVLVFENDRIWNRYNYDRYANNSLFNNVLIPVDKTFSSQAHGSDYTFDIIYYNNFVNSYWVKPQSYLYPFVVDLDDMFNNVPDNEYLFLPIRCYGQSDSLLLTCCSYYRVRNAYGVLDGIRVYQNDLQQVPTSNYLSSIILNERNNQALLDNELTLSSTGLGVYFSTYAGCYRFHSLYKGYLVYAFEYNGGYINFYQAHVNTSLYYSFYSANRYATYEQEHGQGSSMDLFGVGSKLYYNGILYDNLHVRYDSGTYPNSWRFIFGLNAEVSNSLYVNETEARISLQVFNAKYYDIQQTLVRNGAKLHGYYDPNYQYDGNINNVPSSVDNSALNGFFDIMSKCFDSVANVLNIQLFGFITLGGLCFLPLVVMIVLFIVHLFKR